MFSFGDTLATLTDAGNTMSASTEHFYLIPASKAYNVTFTVKLFQAGVELDTYNRTATIPATTMAKGMSYDIKTTLTAQNTSDDGQLYPILFEVAGVTAWDSFGINPTTAISPRGISLMTVVLVWNLPASLGDSAFMP